MLNNPLKRGELVEAHQRELWREAELARHAKATPPNPAGLVERQEVAPDLIDLVERVIQNVWKRLDLLARVPGARPEERQSGLPSGKMRPAHLAVVPLFDLHARRGSMRTQVRLALVCVPLLVLAACGNTTAASPSPTATQPTQTPATSFTVYTSPDHTYRISYPTGWQEQTVDGNPGKVSFTGPNSQEFEVNDNASTPGGDPAQLITEYCQAVQPGQAASQVVGTPVVLGGQTWLKAQCGAAAQPSTVLIVEVVTYKGAVYQIDYASSGASFQADDTTFYMPMEQSFQFLT
jgi:hypothetical protein